MILFPEFLFNVSSETSDREEDVIAYVNTTEMVRPVSTEKIDSLKSTTSSDTQFYKFSHGYDFKHTSTSPYCPQANGEAESGVSIAKKILKQRNPFCTSSSWSYTPHIHRCKPLPVDDGKRNPHPPTYTGILVASGSTEPWSSYQKGWVIQNCIPSVLRQETWIATPSRPTARWFISCKVRSTERREDVWKRHCEKPYCPVTMSSRHLNFGVVRKNVQRSVLVELRWLMNKIWT